MDVRLLAPTSVLLIVMFLRMRTAFSMKLNSRHKENAVCEHSHAPVFVPILGFCLYSADD